MAHGRARLCALAAAQDWDCACGKRPAAAGARGWRHLCSTPLPALPCHATRADSFHKPGFKLHASILHQLFSVLDDATIKAPLWDVAAKGAAAYPSNSAFVREHVAGLLQTSFPNFSAPQVAACVAGMFEFKDFGSFKHHMRDFLVQTKQFASSVRRRPCAHVYGWRGIYGVHGSGRCAFRGIRAFWRALGSVESTSPSRTRTRDLSSARRSGLGSCWVVVMPAGGGSAQPVRGSAV